MIAKKAKPLLAERTSVREYFGAYAGGIPLPTQSSWRVDVQDTLIEQSYRSPAVLMRSAGARTTEAHFDLASRCPDDAV